MCLIGFFGYSKKQEATKKPKGYKSFQEKKIEEKRQIVEQKAKTPI